jgi:PAS domain S-box-containing protein
VQLGSEAHKQATTAVGRSSARRDRRCQLILDAVNEGVATVSPQGRILDANPRLCAMTGRTAAELGGTAAADLFPAAHRPACARLMDIGAAGSARGEAELTGPAGTTVPVLLSVGGFELDGMFVRCLVLTDLTAHRDAEAQVRARTAELEARIRQRTADLERADKNLQSFTYSVAHDLRAPLRGLSGFSEVLLEEYGDRLGETGREYAERIKAASGRMGMLIDDLLRLSQVSRADLAIGPVDLTAEVAAIAAELRSGEPDRRVRFAVQDGVWVRADRTLIRILVRNLLENAWKFTGRRDDATIEFGTTRADAGVCCYVRDNGAGFDPAYLGKLFQPFQRLHAAAEFPGAGIGLAVVQRIVERHDGRAWAEGAIDGGATFYFTMNAADGPAGGGRPAAGASGDPGPGGDSVGGRGGHDEDDH